MQLTVPTVFSTRFVERMDALNRAGAPLGNRVVELYGSFQSSRFSSARPSNHLPAPTREQFRRHVRDARDHGIEFNYLLNAPSYVNLEYTADGQRELDEDVRFLVDCGVTSVTVAIPFVMEMIATRFPNLELVVSAIGAVNALRGLDQFERIGARRVVLDVEVNRDFRFLERAVAQTSLDLEVIVNPVCVYQCHFKQSHYCTTGHGSQKSLDGSGLGHIHNQYYVHRCYLQRLQNEDEYIKGPWVRPEDVRHWKELGIRRYKIAARGSSAERIETIVHAYLQESFDGNLTELLGWRHWDRFRQNADGTTLERLDVHIDNKALDGFIDFFVERRPDCRLGCDRCNYCTTWAERAVTLDRELRDRYVANMRSHVLRQVATPPSQAATDTTVERWSAGAAERRLDE